MNLTDLEQQRRALELNLQKLRQSLKHWNTLEAEYEGLKDEVQQTAPEDCHAAWLSATAKDYASSSDLVNEKEVREIAGLDKDPNSPRSAAQIVGVIERRQEYVQKNIETIQRQFFDTEAKLEEYHFASRSGSDDDGLPLTEINEELDDDDNIVRSSLTRPEMQQTKLLASLRKAGLTQDDLDEEEKVTPHLKPAITNASPMIIQTSELAKKRANSVPDLASSMADSAAATPVPERPPIRKKSVSFTADTKTATEIARIESEDGKKSVSFAAKVAVAPAAPPPDNRSVSFSPTVEEIPPKVLSSVPPEVAPTQIDLEKQKDLRASFKPGDKVMEIGDDDNEIITEHVVVPENESPADAQIRQEMLDYHLNEVGHIVAQIDLDNGNADDEYDDDDDASSHFTGSTYLDDEDTPYTSGMSDDEDEDDDEFGRSKGTMITEDYRKEMLEMQSRLIGNLGPAPKEEDIQDADRENDPHEVRRLVISDIRGSTSSAGSDRSEKKAGGKKRVSFAEELDVAEPGSPPLKAQKQLEGQNVAPVSYSIAERTSGFSVLPPAVQSAAKTSTFRKARSVPKSTDTVAGSADDDSAFLDGATDSFDTPSGPAGKTLVDTLVERPAASTSKSSANSPACKHAAIAERRQLAAEYYRRRNDIIKQQGGFKRDEDEDEEIGELMEERDGKLKKVSQFKAARIRPQ